MNKYNVVFFHADNHNRETITDVLAPDKRQAALEARIKKGYFDSCAHQVLKVEEVKELQIV